MPEPRLIAATGLAVAAFREGCRITFKPLLPARQSDPLRDNGFTRIARFAHISDTHVVDEQSPARFTRAHPLTLSVWRPYEACSIHLLDGIIRAINRIHAAGRPIDFVLHTGDAIDNAQANELTWFLTAMQGGAIDPLSGPDDRLEADLPEPDLDPHAAFEAQGLYRRGVHGDLDSIPWYALFGNHDVYAMGLFPILEAPAGGRFAPLPLGNRPGILLPVHFDSVGSLAYGRVTPADPGPPRLLEIPAFVEPNPDRAYLMPAEIAEEMSRSPTQPEGHGLGTSIDQRGWYSLTPVPGLRLIGLNTNDSPVVIPGCIYEPGAVSPEQVAFLEAELQSARNANEVIIVCTHQPSERLGAFNPSAVDGAGFREILADCPNLIVHLAGHKHRNRVVDHGTYIEIETCSTLDWPQEGRLLEIWRHPDNGDVAITYEMVHHLDDDLPPLGDDPLRPLRQLASELARETLKSPTLLRPAHQMAPNPDGQPGDRQGMLLRNAGR